jgi:SAM-dependent methyltransferase
VHDRVAWRQCDLNRPGFAQQLDLQADLVLSLAVWEHVLRPDLFVRNLLAILRPGGMLYLVSPDHGSAMRFLMRRHWPYFLPGEHLNVATCNGARACLERTRKEGPHAQQAVFASPVWAHYPLRYVLKYLRLGPVARLLPPVSLPLPVGILEAGIKPAGSSRG